MNADDPQPLGEHPDLTMPAVCRCIDTRAHELDLLRRQNADYAALAVALTTKLDHANHQIADLKFALKAAAEQRDEWKGKYYRLESKVTL